MIITESELRKLVKNVLVEEYDEDYRAGEYLDAREKAAKEAYEAAKAALAAWDDNEKKRLALIAAIEEKAREQKISV